jgi:hypothetical protein
VTRYDELKFRAVLDGSPKFGLLYGNVWSLDFAEISHNLKPANLVLGILKGWGTSRIFRRGSKKPRLQNQEMERK